MLGAQRTGPDFTLPTPV